MRITLKSGKTFLIDKADAELVNAYSWHIGVNGYVRSNVYLGGGRKAQKTMTLYLHRLLMQPPIGMDTDHINGDRLDNRRANLRVCTRSENVANTRSIRGASPYRGVSRIRGRFHAEIKVKGRRHFIGSFATEIEAARAYNEAATANLGRFAHLNPLPKAVRDFLTTKPREIK